MKARRKARTVALQALYEIDSTAHLPEVVVEERLAEQALPAELNDFARQLVAGVIGHAQTLDALIQKYAPEWPLDQMAIIDRNILRIAIWEFAADRQTPIKVAINEAVELAKLYGSDSAPRFVNGVLGALALRQAEITSFFGPNRSRPPADPLRPAG
ncbi:MAG: transcription antitermination factor NusB [Anaerolineales bacterium]|nr:transcription antitermination factor NusB [Anaerolineales bacterium]